MRVILALGLIALLSAAVLCFHVLRHWQGMQTQRLEALADQTGGRMAMLAQLYQQKLELETHILQADAQIQTLRAELDDARSRLNAALLASAQITAVGPGVVVSIQPLREEAGAVLDSDLLRIVNELNAGGAEALAINGIRLGARTQVRSVGDTVFVGAQGIQLPYEVAAIGEPAVLEKAITFTGGIATQLQSRMNLTVTRHQELALPPLLDERPYQYAQVFGERAP